MSACPALKAPLAAVRHEKVRERLRLLALPRLDLKAQFTGTFKALDLCPGLGIRHRPIIRAVKGSIEQLELKGFLRVFWQRPGRHQRLKTPGDVVVGQQKFDHDIQELLLAMGGEHPIAGKVETSPLRPEASSMR